MSALDKWRMLKNRRKSILSAGVREEKPAESSSTTPGVTDDANDAGVPTKREPQASSVNIETGNSAGESQGASKASRWRKIRASVYDKDAPLNAPGTPEHAKEEMEAVNYLSKQLEETRKINEVLTDEKNELIGAIEEIEHSTISQLRKVFESIDTDNSGEIDMGEFKVAMREDSSVREFFGLTNSMKDAEEFFEKMFVAMDADDDKSITFLEFEQHIARMALNSMIDMREEFEDEKHEMRMKMAEEMQVAVSEEAQKVTENYSKYAAKAVSKAQKKAERLDRKLQAANEVVATQKEKIEKLMEELKRQQDRESKLPPKSNVQRMYEDLMSVRPDGVLSEVSIFQKLLDDSTKGSYFGLGPPKINKVWKSVLDGRLKVTPIVSLSEFENFVCSLTGNFVMYIQRLQEQKTTIQNSAKRLETKSKKETKQLELELTQSQELVKEYKELIDDLEKSEKRAKEVHKKAKIKHQDAEEKWQESINKLKHQHAAVLQSTDEKIAELKASKGTGGTESSGREPNAPSSSAGLHHHIPDFMSKMNDVLERLHQEKAIAALLKERLRASQQKCAKHQNDCHELRARLRDNEDNHMSGKNDVEMESRINLILQKAGTLMNERAETGDIEESRFRMEALIFQFDKCARSLHDTHDETTRHLVFVRSRLERLLEKLEGPDPQTIPSPHITEYTPGTPRDHRSPRAGLDKTDLSVHHGSQPHTLLQLATSNIGAAIHSVTKGRSDISDDSEYDHDHHVAKQSLTKSLASMSTLVSRLHAAKKGNQEETSAGSKHLEQFMSSPVSDDGGAMRNMSYT